MTTGAANATMPLGALSTEEHLALDVAALATVFEHHLVAEFAHEVLRDGE